MKFRCSSHKLPIETGRRFGIDREERICKDCDMNVLGDEYHFIVECPKSNIIRKKCIPNFYIEKKSVFNFCNLMSGGVKLKLGLAKFIKWGKGV